MIKSQKELREYFWACYPEYQPDFRTRKRQNDYKCDIRCAWVDLVDTVRREGKITEKLANRATL